MCINLAKDDPRLLAINTWVATEFDNGRQTSIEWEELAPLVRQHIGAAMMEK